VSSAQDLVCRLRRRGVAITTTEERLQIEAPPGTISDAEKTELQALKSEILALLRAQDRALALTVTKYQHAGLVSEIRVVGVEQSLWIVPRDGDRGCLVRRDVRPGSIWTIGELAVLARASPAPAADFRRLAHLRSIFDATIIELAPPGLDEIERA
jgi:hypothetical protein